MTRHQRKIRSVFRNIRILGNDTMLITFNIKCSKTMHPTTSVIQRIIKHFTFRNGIWSLVYPLIMQRSQDQHSANGNTSYLHALMKIQSNIKLS